MTEQVIAHKTTDGKIFEDEALAEAHESRLIAMRELVPLVRRMPPVLSSFDASDAIEYMVDHREEFIRALQGQEATADEIDGERDTLDTSSLDPEDRLGDLIDEVEMREQLGTEPRADDDIPF